VDLEINLPDAAVVSANEERWQLVSRQVIETLYTEEIASADCYLIGERSDPFVVEVAIANPRIVTRDRGVRLAVAIQNRMRAKQCEGWVVRCWIQPSCEDLVMDYVIWLDIDCVRIAEYRGRRLVETFKTVGEFDVAVWGAAKQ